MAVTHFLSFSLLLFLFLSVRLSLSLSLFLSLFSLSLSLSLSLSTPSLSLPLTSVSCCPTNKSNFLERKLYLCFYLVFSSFFFSPGRQLPWSSASNCEVVKDIKEADWVWSLSSGSVFDKVTSEQRVNRIAGDECLLDGTRLSYLIRWETRLFLRFSLIRFSFRLPLHLPIVLVIILWTAIEFHEQVLLLVSTPLIIPRLRWWFLYLAV